MAIPIRQQAIIKQRVEKFFLIVVVFYVGLIGRLVYLQAINGGYYREKAAKLREQEIPLQAQRGAILDRDGKPLAVTTYTGILVCDPTLVKEPAKTAATVAALVGATPSEILPLVSRKVMPNGKQDRHVIIREGLSPDVVEAIRKARADKSLRKSLEGLALDEHAERSYPAGRDAVQIVGLTMPDKTGKAKGALGLEQSYDSVLRGVDGFMRAEVDARRRVIPDTQRERKDHEDGLDVRLTLDSTVQHIAETELEAGCKEANPVGATVIVMDPKTGDILAMASAPSFDPQDRSALANPAEPQLNRALSLYEPGSTLKILTAAAALDSKIITPSTKFYCNGRLPIGKKTINCVLHGAAERYGHGEETILEIMEHSCNVGTAQIGIKVGLEHMAQSLTEFGLMDKTGLNLPTDTRGRLGLGEEAQRGGAAKVARVAFGQSVMVTPLGLATAYASIANDGVLMKPRLVQLFRDQTGKVVRRFAPEKVRQVISPQTAADLKTLLRAVVVSGTGKNCAVPGYTVAGKTGTAQKVGKGARGYSSGKYVASFIGFLPVSNPRAVIFVVMDEPRSGSYYGAQAAGPVFQRIAQQLMWYWKVTPDDPSTLQATRTAGR
jgi:stage V sporulation protein D (sporulation-specific penicillin-binding protein)